jgi:hypothetical protein
MLRDPSGCYLHGVVRLEYEHCVVGALLFVDHGITVDLRQEEFVGLRRVHVNLTQRVRVDCLKAKIFPQLAARRFPRRFRRNPSLLRDRAAQRRHGRSSCRRPSWSRKRRRDDTRANAAWLAEADPRRGANPGRPNARRYGRRSTAVTIARRLSSIPTARRESRRQLGHTPRSRADRKVRAPVVPSAKVTRCPPRTPGDALRHRHQYCAVR